ncbi:dTDP-4-dehydrorhamnose 3,5-epimerase [Fulvivirga lutea]|uniref:dTDP-4-dehydrorhamnose 3,5-epimerase n=1 Tax=Fulvivirga lutea TaxID=2810512 RepID=A0A974WH26_9BACT|nr:dTDP-4-dehydrorhamnose 3,5-epimerase [Fulvivirga lutea]QSE98414.1 dTDP-4-dehydrorhamnose 3,5-epimerase [Fulvivirga lutea]
MEIIKTDFEGLLILVPKVIVDSRGFFMESYNYNKLKELGIDNNFVQDNHSLSEYGVIRGLHFQNPPYAQTKLIRAISGEILDVVVDIRKSSSTYGKHLSVMLSAENKKQLLIPKGFAHGFSVISENAEILYKCDNFYNKSSEGGLKFNDTDLNIDWKIPKDKVLVSDKDLNQLNFQSFKSQFE